MVLPQPKNCSMRLRHDLVWTDRRADLDMTPRALPHIGSRDVVVRRRALLQQGGDEPPRMVHPSLSLFKLGFNDRPWRSSLFSSN